MDLGKTELSGWILHKEGTCQNIWPPTLLDLAGTQFPDDLQGRSFKSMLQGHTPADWRQSVYYHYYEQYNVPEHFGIRTDSAKLINYPTIDRWELFDLGEDPDELINVYSDSEYTVIRERLEKKLKSLAREYQDPLHKNLTDQP